MKILIINAGSSSIKYQLLEMPSEQVLCKGIIERIGEKDAIFKYKTDVTDLDEVLDIPSHKVGLNKIAEHLLDSKIGVIKNADEIEIIGHRVVHGGKSFSKTTLITEEVKNEIDNILKKNKQKEILTFFDKKRIKFILNTKYFEFSKK